MSPISDKRNGISICHKPDRAIYSTGIGFFASVISSVMVKMEINKTQNSEGKIKQKVCRIVRGNKAGSGLAWYTSRIREGSRSIKGCLANRELGRKKNQEQKIKTNDKKCNIARYKRIFALFALQRFPLPSLKNLRQQAVVCNYIRVFVAE